jgi:transposase InsO family protein
MMSLHDLGIPWVLISFIGKMLIICLSHYIANSLSFANYETSKPVVANLKAIFEEHGIPSKMISDNGTQYTSSTFQEFSRAYGFAHVTSSPMYSQSNGLGERAVQTVKRLLQKCQESNLVLALP